MNLKNKTFIIIETTLHTLGFIVGFPCNTETSKAPPTPRHKILVSLLELGSSYLTNWA